MPLWGAHHREGANSAPALLGSVVAVQVPVTELLRGHFTVQTSHSLLSVRVEVAFAQAEHTRRVKRKRRARSFRNVQQWPYDYTHASELGGRTMVRILYILSGGALRKL